MFVKRIEPSITGVSCSRRAVIIIIIIIIIINVRHLYVPRPLPGTDGESVNPQFKFDVEHLYHDRY